MPVEIKELVIRAVAADGQSAGRADRPGPSDPQDKESLVEDCVRRVLQILKSAKER